MFALFSILILLAPSKGFSQISQEKILKAEVIQILSEKETETPEGTRIRQQNLLLRGLEGEILDREFRVDGISDMIVLKNSRYEVGDAVLVTKSPDPRGNEQFYITDYVRTSSLAWLTAIFLFIVLFVAKKKGARSLMVLALTFGIIIYFLVPALVAGYNALALSLVAGMAILFLAIFATEGFNKKSMIAYVSLIISLTLAILLSWLFTEFSRLTGLGDDDALTLLGMANQTIQLKGLLLAGMVIGTLGVLDDIVISQISVCWELSATNPRLPSSHIYKKAMRVGIDHINAIVNTLFLAYAGAGLPLLVIFSYRQEPFMDMFDILNNEIIATEIVRTLVGSISLVLAVPIATILASNAFAGKATIDSEHVAHKH